MPDLTCRAPHPGWQRDPQRYCRPHGKPLPVTLPSDTGVELVRVYPAGAERPQVRSGYIEVHCAAKDCGAVHLFRLVAKQHVAA